MTAAAAFGLFYYKHFFSNFKKKINARIIQRPKAENIAENHRNGGLQMDTLALILAIVGAINWGLVGIFRFDLVAWIFGGQTAGLSRVIFTLVGLAGLWCISLLFRRGANASMEG